MDKVQIFQSPPSSQELTLHLFTCIILNFTIMALDKFFPKYISRILLAYHEPSLFEVSHEPSSWHHLLVQGENGCKTMAIETETIPMQDIGIKREEVGFIMSDLGISLSKEEDQIKEHVRYEELSTLFDQMEPGLHEIKEAFSIFDKNRDGFIDSKELQTVLIDLGLREGTDLDACQSMIDKHDRNHDGKIDQSDFFKLVESALL